MEKTEINKKRAIRDFINLTKAILLCWLYLPHFCLYRFNHNLYNTLNSDLKRRDGKLEFNLPINLMFIFYIHNDRYFRNLFYHRIGPAMTLLIKWWRPGDRYFVISKTTQIGGGAYFAHPYASELNAKSIGKNFSCRSLTTLGNKIDGDNENRPVIGDNVTLGVNVTVIGGITIGDNVTIGAGSVVVKDIPSNCIAAGNPCKPIKYLEQE